MSERLTTEQRAELRAQITVLKTAEGREWTVKDPVALADLLLGYLDELDSLDHAEAENAALRARVEALTTLAHEAVSNIDEPAWRERYWERLEAMTGGTR